jgi:hypothetical protein
MGPVINRRAYEAYKAHVAELRTKDRVVTGGGYYLQQYMREQSQTIIRQGRGWEEDEERGELSE